MPLRIGTSGWQYRHWNGPFYPRRPAPEDDLAFYADRFDTVELNGTFYKLPERRTFRDWSGRVPEGFTFAMKASRFLTHIKRLKEPREPIERMLARSSALARAHGPVLLQLPPDFRRDDGRLDDALGAFPRRVRVAVEFRHASWFTDDVRRILQRRGAALCIADRDSRLLSPAWRTADWGYVRFHGGRGRPASCYGRTALTTRAVLLQDLFGPDPDVFVYFNNDGHACALRDARRFALEAERVGLHVTRLPRTEDVVPG